MLGVVVLAAVCVGVTFSPLQKGRVGKPSRGVSDVKLYRAEVERIRAGEGYYPAAAAELTARGYPTRSVFNWRTPLPMWLLGQMPEELGKALLGGLALVLLLLGFEAVARDAADGPSHAVEPGGETGEQSPQRDRPRGAVRRAVLVALLLTGPLVFCVLGDLYVMPVLWAGVLIALSLAAYGVDRPWLGVTLGLAALFVRDLALAYCVVSAGIAWWNRRHGELLGWVAGMAAWAAFYGLHWSIVAGLIAPDARAHPVGWVRLSGIGFVIATTQMTAYLLLLPQWVAALYFAAGIVGLAGWNTRLGLRFGLTACAFITAFAGVGHEFNQYWGCLTAPLWCFGVARVPASIYDIWFAAEVDLRRAFIRLVPARTAP